MKKIIGWFKDSDIRNILGMVITIGAFLVIYLLVIKPIPIENKEVLIAAVGYTLAKLGDVTSYYFGASKTDEKPKE